MKFNGFPKDALQFFKKLRKNNNREWFEANKETFLASVRAPMEDLVVLVNAELAKFAPDHMTETKKAIYRIYRDTRFSADKTPYKTHIAANFPRKSAEKHSYAGYYFGISDESMEVAGGVYMPGPAELTLIRGYIAEQHAALKKIATSKKIVELLGPFQGSALQRVPRGFAPDHPAADYLRMKQWMFFQSFDSAVVLTPELPAFIASRFKAVAPLVDYINTPLLAAARRASSSAG